MKTNKAMFLKGVKFLGFTVALMFTAPFTIYQAFKNQEHPFYLPVLILGFLLAIGAIGMGFWSIKIIVDAFFGKSDANASKD
jgi:NADH:ubiquinone oxidoreductase subunit 5 (subunit L)/multisubunit Na+/H+ antiporter MnhA subunit